MKKATIYIFMLGCLLTTFLTSGAIVVYKLRNSSMIIYKSNIISYEYAKRIIDYNHGYGYKKDYPLAEYSLYYKIKRSYNRKLESTDDTLTTYFIRDWRDCD